MNFKEIKIRYCWAIDQTTLEKTTLLSFGIEHKLDSNISFVHTYYITSSDEVILEEEIWFFNGITHKTDGPAFIEYGDNGEILCESWYLNGKMHKTDAPADIYYNDIGEIIAEFWHLNGKYHRIDGPAYIQSQGFQIGPTGEVHSERWYIKGKEIEPNKWLEENGYTWPLNKDQQTELLLSFA